MNETLIIILAIEIAIVLVFLIVEQPFLGVAFMISSLPVIDLLPEIPYLTSVVPLIGAITIISFLIQKRNAPGKSLIKFKSVLVFGILFIIWIYLSNPDAAWSGIDRNWVLTFIQLWVLMFLVGELLDTPKKQQVVMLIFSGVTIVSAFYAVTLGEIAEDALSSARVSGLATNANEAARYFVVAMVFLSYLRTQTKTPFLRFLALGGILITFLGVFFTVSRSGILLLFGAQGLIIFLQPQLKQKTGLTLVFVVGFIIIGFLSDNIFNIIGDIFPTIIEGTDTMGLRYNLWKAGWQMWLDHPVRGVGIGMYQHSMGSYILNLVGPVRVDLVAHNTFVQVLSETGIIGFILFMLMVFNALKNFWNAKFKDDLEAFSLRNVWLIVFLVVVVVGGITQSGHASKLTWMVMGVCVYFANQAKMAEQVDVAKETTVKYSRKKLWIERHKI